MTISAEQLARLVLEIMAAHASGAHDLTNPSTIWDLIGRTYPDIDGISAPPSAAAMQRRYIEDSFAYCPTPGVMASSLTTIGPESSEYNRRLQSAKLTPEMMDPEQQLLAGLDRLRGNPMAALSFVTSMAMGRNRSDAMRVAQATSATYNLVTARERAAVVDRSESSGGPTPVRPKADVPDAYSPAEIRARLSRGYHGGV